MIHTPDTVEIAPGTHWIGALDPSLREFDIILKTANGTTYNSYCVRGTNGVAIIDTVKESHAEEFFRRLEQVARYDEITTIVLNRLEPDHSGRFARADASRTASQAIHLYQGSVDAEGTGQRSRTRIQCG